MLLESGIELKEIKQNNYKEGNSYGRKYKKSRNINTSRSRKYYWKNAEYIRALLRQGKVNWGTAVEGKSGQWNYNIIKSKFFEYANIKTNEQDNMLNLIYLELAEINKKLSLKE